MQGLRQSAVGHKVKRMKMLMTKKKKKMPKKLGRRGRKKRMMQMRMKAWKLGCKGQTKKKEKKG